MSRPNISRRIRLAVYSRDNWTCQYCQLQFDQTKTWTPSSIAPFVTDDNLGYLFLELDHIHPRHHGGLDVEDNLCAACTRCNRKKSFKIPEAAD